MIFGMRILIGQSLENLWLRDWLSCTQGTFPSFIISTHLVNKTLIAEIYSNPILLIILWM